MLKKLLIIYLFILIFIGFNNSYIQNISSNYDFDSNKYNSPNDLSLNSSSTDIVNDMSIGWNLAGNFDKMADEAHAKLSFEEYSSSDDYNDDKVAYINYYETKGGDPIVTQELINEVKSKGFNTIRLCVTWRDHLYFENISKNDSHKMFFASTDDASMSSTEELKRKMPLIEFRYSDTNDDGTIKYDSNGEIIFLNQDVRVLFPQLVEQSWRVLDNGKYYANSNYIKNMSISDIKTIKIDKAWLERIHDVVKMIIDNNMYCILNLHDDVGIGRQSNGGYGYFLPIIYTIQNPNTPDGQQKVEKMETALATIWTEIANYFKDFNHQLLFEGFNEIQSERTMYIMYDESGRNIDNLVNYSHPWISATNLYRKDDEIQLVNDYNRVFIDAVRKTGGNNTQRFLIINPYAAEANERALSLFNLKKNPDESDQEYNDIKSRVIMSAHLYDNYYTEPGDKSSDNQLSSYNKLTRIYNKAKSLDVPVIIGEFGSSLYEFKQKIMANQGVDENTAEELAEIEVSKSNNFIVRTVKEFNEQEKNSNSNVVIKCIYYDHDTDVESYNLLDRNTLNWKHTIVLNGILNGVNGQQYDYVNIDKDNNFKSNDDDTETNIVEVDNTLKNTKNLMLIFVLIFIISILLFNLIKINKRQNNINK